MFKSVLSGDMKMFKGDAKAELSSTTYKRPELKTLEWDILNANRLINLEINNKRRTRII